MTPADRLLWPVISAWLGYVETLFLVTVAGPLSLGVALPPTPGWVTFYAVAVVGLASAAATVVASRGRWLAWRGWATAAALQSTRSVIDRLITRDLGRP